MRSKIPTDGPRWLLHATLGAAAILVALGFSVRYWLGDSAAAWAALDGAEVVVSPATVDVGECAYGEIRDLQFRVLNRSSVPLTVTGIYTSCSCLLASSLPILVEAHSAATLRIKIHSSESEGEFLRQATVYTNSKVSPQIPITVTGTIVRGDAPSEIEPISASAPLEPVSLAEPEHFTSPAGY